MNEHFDCIGRNYDVVLDSTSSDHGLEEMWFYQGDIGGTLTIFLHEAGLPMNLPPDGKVMCFFERKDKNIVQRELQLLTRSESKYVATIDNAILEVAGKVKCEVKVYHCENRTTFATFEITSKKSMSIEGGVDTPEKYDLIQTVMAQGLRLDEVDESLQLNNEAHESFVQSLHSHQEAINNLRQLLVDADTKIDTNIEEVNNNLSVLQTSFEQSLSSLATTLSNNIQLANSRIDELNSSTSNSFQEFTTKFEELGTDTEVRFSDVSNQVNTLATTKVSVIESEEEPDTTDLPVGTLWIKPQVIAEPSE